MVHSAPSIFNSSVRISAFSSLSSAHRNLIPWKILSFCSFFSSCTVEETDLSSAILRSMRTSSFFCSWAISKGMVMTNTDPTPTWLVTSILPFICSIKPLVIAIPRPVPCILLVTEPSARVNGSKIVSLKSADIPMPLSLTKKRYFA